MGFSQEWEQKFRKSGGMSLWPWSELISHCKRHFRGKDGLKGLRVLELGCAKGANIPFFLSEGADYHGLEGSPSMVADLLKRHPSLPGKVVAEDFTREIPFPGPFDLVVDRSSLTHNHTQAIRKCLALVRAKMAPGAKFIGVDWFSTSHSDFSLGKPADDPPQASSADLPSDPYTKRDFPSGNFMGLGLVHFSDQAHLEDLFRDFSLETLEHKVIERKIPPPSHLHAMWALVASKRGNP